MIIEIIPCLSDNYSYLIYEKKSNTVSIVDPAEFEKKKDIFSLYESEMEMYKQKAEDEEIKGYEDFEGIEEEWEDFNQRDSKDNES